jgi:hypothetical protein
MVHLLIDYVAAKNLRTKEVVGATILTVVVAWLVSESPACTTHGSVIATRVQKHALSSGNITGLNARDTQLVLQQGPQRALSGMGASRLKPGSRRTSPPWHDSPAINSTLMSLCYSAAC